MDGASFALVVNFATAALFAASFAIVAFVNPTHRAALWFSLSYLIGMLTPISLFILPRTSWPAPFAFASYATFAGGLLCMTAALALFYRRTPPWRLIAAIIVITTVIGLLIWNGPRNTLAYELAYQLPFALASAASGWVILRVSRRTPLEVTLAMAFGIIAIHFPIKAFLAVGIGTGATPREYIHSLYALFSQATTGILLIAAGLLVLLIAVQSVITDAQIAADTDPLSGLANRRGFDAISARILREARRLNYPTSVIVLDLDHFKQINDTYGHAMGDEVIRSFADLLKRSVPAASLVARIGGEEFAVLLERTSAGRAKLIAETIRLAVEQNPDEILPQATVSAGVADISSNESCGEAIRRADLALYEAKATGRNRVCLAAAPRPHNVVPLLGKAGRPFR
ncbi:GGDEF domain-containing protein [Xanthobacter sp. DSM 24535]|uniref:GGDEF domain-containing protein n=1 Tax=Roseixanthobacter psychrophilus TaxID=3119917 RepID=UPI003729655A